MAREGLMDDCGYDFEPSVAEEQAYIEGYEQGFEDGKADIAGQVENVIGDFVNGDICTAFEVVNRIHSITRLKEQNE